MVALNQSHQPLAHCPSIDEWTRFLDGKLGDLAIDSCASHLADCIACLATLDNCSKHSSEKSRLYFPSPYLEEEGFFRLERQLARFDAEQPCKSNIVLQIGAPAGNSENLATLGRYNIVRLLGTGAFGEVYLAQDPLLARDVAIKVPRKSRFQSEAALSSFLTEARHAAALDHPGIVSIYDLLEGDSGQILIVMKFVSGQTLLSILRSEKLTLQRSANIVKQIADAVHFAHERGFVHRDLKPSNILIDDVGNAYVTDFGLGLNLSEEIPDLHGLAGTPPYMSPEQIENKVIAIDRRSDIWALGVILVELVHGARPFAQRVRHELFQAILTDEPSIESTIETKTIDEIAKRCLAKSSSERFQSADDLAIDLEDWLKRNFPSGKWSKRNPAFAMLLLCVGLLIPLTVVAYLATAGFVRSSGRGVRLEERIQAVREATNAELPLKIDSLRPIRKEALGRLHSLLDDSSLSDFERYKVSRALCELGVPSVEALIKYIPLLEPQYATDLSAFMQADTPTAIMQLRFYSEQTDSVETRSVFTLFLALLGDATCLEQAVADNRDPSKRTIVIDVLSNWCGQEMFAKLLKLEISCDLQYAILLAMASSDFVGETEQCLVEMVKNLFIESSDSGVHSGARSVLVHLGIELPTISSSSIDKLAPEHPAWISVHDFTLMVIPQGRLELPRGQSIELSADIYFSDTEVSRGLYEKFLNDPRASKRAQLPDRSRAFSPTTDCPTLNIRWLDAIMFCNWLSEQDDLTPCYVLIEAGDVEDLGNWKWNQEANGYRLPTATEWEYATRAGSVTTNFFGEDDSKILRYGVSYVFKPVAQTEPCASRLPNRFGLFDVLGNVSEWCWDATENGQKRIVCGSSAFGGLDKFKSSLRIASDPEGSIVAVGFRVVRNRMQK